MSSGGERLFTKDDAEALLPAISRLLERAAELVARLAASDPPEPTSTSGHRPNGRVSPNGAVHAHHAAREANVRALERILAKIRAKGVLVRDVRTGLIDFPALREGRTVYLCWRRGEPLRIAWWHDSDTGFAGRQPL